MKHQKKISFQYSTVCIALNTAALSIKMKLCICHCLHLIQDSAWPLINKLMQHLPNPKLHKFRQKTIPLTSLSLSNSESILTFTELQSTRSKFPNKNHFGSVEDPFVQPKIQFKKPPFLKKNALNN